MVVLESSALKDGYPVLASSYAIYRVRRMAATNFQHQTLIDAGKKSNRIIWYP
jgi:hypothetical protein